MSAVGADVISCRQYSEYRVTFKKHSRLETVAKSRLLQYLITIIGRQSEGSLLRGRDGTESPGHGSPGHRVCDFGRVGSRVSVSDRLFDPILSFNKRVYRGVVSTE